MTTNLSSNPSKPALAAKRRAISMADIDPDQLGVVVNTSVCRDYIEPSTACLVHGNLKPANIVVAFFGGESVASSYHHRSRCWRRPLWHVGA